jgi:hypothetical protein
MSDRVWNVIGAMAIGVAIAMLILAWPFIENLFFVGVMCALPLGLVLGFVRARITEWHWRGDRGQEALGYSYGNSEDYRSYHDRLHANRR